MKLFPFFWVNLKYHGSDLFSDVRKTTELLSVPTYCQKNRFVESSLWGGEQAGSISQRKAVLVDLGPEKGCPRSSFTSPQGMGLVKGAASIKVRSLIAHKNCGADCQLFGQRRFEPSNTISGNNIP